MLDFCAVLLFLKSQSLLGKRRNFSRLYCQETSCTRISFQLCLALQLGITPTISFSGDRANQEQDYGCHYFVAGQIVTGISFSWCKTFYFNLLYCLGVAFLLTVTIWLLSRMYRLGLFPWMLTLCSSQLAGVLCVIHLSVPVPAWVHVTLKQPWFLLLFQASFY